MIQENQLETINGKLCQVVLRSKCYDNPKKECDSGLITSARLKMSSNVDRFLNKRRLENATWVLE